MSSSSIPPLRRRAAPPGRSVLLHLNPLKQTIAHSGLKRPASERFITRYGPIDFASWKR